jgi:hypothetical protein
VDAGLWDKIEVLPFSGIINKLESTTVSSARKPCAYNVCKGEMTNYVMDHCCYSRSLVASWYDY